MASLTEVNESGNPTHDNGKNTGQQSNAHIPGTRGPSPPNNGKQSSRRPSTQPNGQQSLSFQSRPRSQKNSTVPNQKDSIKDNGLHSGGPVKPKSRLHWLWFAGHIYTCIGTAIELVLYITLQGWRPWARVYYHSVFLVIVMTYGLSLRRKLQGQIPDIYALMPIDTFQYMALACIWFCTHGHFLKLVPYFVYSLLHSCDFIANRLYPGTTMSKDIKASISKHTLRLEKITVYSNLLLLGRLLLDVLLLRRGATIAFLAFCFFMRIRVAYTDITKDTLKEIESAIDTYIMNKENIPQKYKEKWRLLKSDIDSFSATQLTRPRVKRGEEGKRDHNYTGGKDSNLWIS